ncbi:MAG: dihydroneopterin aldolase [Pseudomonadota bacterium]
MDKLTIHELTIETSIGVHDWEKKLKQKLVFDIEIHFDFSQAYHSDELDHTIDYTKLAEFTTSFCQQRHFNLVEHLAYQLSQTLKQEFHLSKVILSVAKAGVIANARKISFCCTA